MKIFNKKSAQARHPNYRAHEVEYKPNFTLWVILIGIVLLGLWASWAELDQITRAQGQVIASSRTQIIQSSDGGILEEMLVKEGDTVSKGQVLARLDRAKVEAAFFEAQSKVAALRATVARLRAEVFGGEPDFGNLIKGYPQFKDNQILLLKKRRRAINEEISSLEALLALGKKELDMNMPLLKNGDVSMADILKLQRQVADISAQIGNKRNKYIQDTQAELSKAEEDLSGAEQALAQRKDQLDHVDLKAPTNGVIKNVRITTLGGVLKPSEEVMQIVPIEDSLVVEAKVKPVDVAFLKPGLDASVKIDSYDYTVYGSLYGKLTYISADTLTEDLKQGEQAYYRVQVKTEGKKFSGRPEENLEIQPGMTATIEIKTGKNTVLKYIFKPVIKTMSESLGER
jgi:adhesin transport system membrane fusion protein